MATESFLDPIRSAIPASFRERAYVVVTALVGIFAAQGVVTDAAAPVWISVGAAAVTLFFAVLYSTSTVRLSLYALLGTVSTVAQLYGYFSSTQWSSYLGLAAALLGLSFAAAKTPTPITNGAGSVASFGGGTGDWETEAEFS
jgi:hypothetical protein